LAFIPHLFSWYNVTIAFLMLQITGGFGISIGYHRMLAHRSLANVNPVFGAIHTLCGALALQMGPISWARIHRDHHKFTDSVKDPHDNHKGFFYSHIGWMLEKMDMSKFQFGTDLVKINYVKFIEKYYVTINIVFLLSLFILGFYLGTSNPLGLHSNLDMKSGLQKGFLGGVGMIVWAGFARIAVLYHLTWSINSVCHRFGYTNFKSDDNTGTSRNNIFIGYFSFGEGWHNNHHKFPYSAKFSVHWWEIDISWLYIIALSKVGLLKPKVFFLRVDQMEENGCKI
jgi:fatty-acid desaturase